MKCPNCGQENADGAAECLNCQVIFGKWKERGQEKAAPAGPSMPDAAEDGPGKTSPLPKILLVLAVAAFPAWYLLKPAAKQEAPASAQQPAAAETLVVHAGDQQPDPEPAAPAVPQGLWKFEGSVIDLLKETPVEGASLKFYNNSDGETFQALTDGTGRYSLDLKPLEKGGYGLFITHPGYGNQHWEAGAAKKSLKERCRMGKGVQAMSIEELMRHTGNAGGIAIYDFAAYPNSLDKLTEKEKDECWRGITGR